MAEQWVLAGDSDMSCPKDSNRNHLHFRSCATASCIETSIAVRWECALRNAQRRVQTDSLVECVFWANLEAKGTFQGKLRIAERMEMGSNQLQVFVVSNARNRTLPVEPHRRYKDEPSGASLTYWHLKNVETKPNSSSNPSTFLCSVWTGRICG